MNSPGNQANMPEYAEARKAPSEPIYNDVVPLPASTDNKSSEEHIYNNARGHQANNMGQPITGVEGNSPENSNSSSSNSPVNSNPLVNTNSSSSNSPENVNIAANLNVHKGNNIGNKQPGNVVGIQGNNIVAPPVNQNIGMAPPSSSSLDNSEMSNLNNSNNLSGRVNNARTTLEGVNEYLEYCENLQDAYGEKHKEIIEATDRLDKIVNQIMDVSVMGMKKSDNNNSKMVDLVNKLLGYIKKTGDISKGDISKINNIRNNLETKIKEQKELKNKRERDHVAITNKIKKLKDQVKELSNSNSPKEMVKKSNLSSKSKKSKKINSLFNTPRTSDFNRPTPSRRNNQGAATELKGLQDLRREKPNLKVKKPEAYLNPMYRPDSLPLGILKRIGKQSKRGKKGKKGKRGKRSKKGKGKKRSRKK